MTALDDAMNAFLTVLRSSWSTVRNSLVESAGWNESVLSDWAQANWEMIVEAALSKDGNVALEPYGDGADCTGSGSRVWKPSAHPTHAVACRAHGATVRDRLTDTVMIFPAAGLPVWEFVTVDEDTGWYRAMPPFDCALFDVDGNDVVVDLSDLSFTLQDVAATKA